MADKQELRARAGGKRTTSNDENSWKGFAQFEFPVTRAEDFRNWYKNAITHGSLWEDVGLMLSERQHKASISWDSERSLFWFSITSKTSASPSFGYTLPIKASTIEQAAALYLYVMQEIYTHDDWANAKQDTLGYLFS